jgi:hypothetical protein
MREVGRSPRTAVDAPVDLRLCWGSRTISEYPSRITDRPFRDQELKWYCRNMRLAAGLAIILTLSSCSHRSEREAQREREERDRNSAAFKVGEAAHEIAKHAEKTAAAAERELQESARKAREGWKEKEKEDREKARQNQ